MEDYNQKLYKFIRDQIKDVKYIYKEHRDAIFNTGKEHYGLKNFTPEEWSQAFEWAIEDEFNGGCEVIT